MNHRLACAVVLIMSVAGCHADDAGRRPEVDLSGLQEILIDYEYMGWGVTEERFSITPGGEPGTFTLRGHYQGIQGSRFEVNAPIPADDVANFVWRVSSPAWSRARGIHGLERRIDRASLHAIEPQVRSPPLRCSQQALERLAKRHFDGDALLRLIDAHYGNGQSWTDDYPRAMVQLRWRDKPLLVIWSESQKALMLPWHMGAPTEQAANDENWSLPLTVAVQALVPPASRIHERLDGLDRTERDLRWKAMRLAEKECEDLHSRPAAPVQ